MTRCLIVILMTLVPMTFVPQAEAGELDRVMAGVYAERAIRRAYGPIDYAINNYGSYAYGSGNMYGGNVVQGAVIGAGVGASIGRSTKGALIGAGIGGTTAGVVTWLMNRRRGHGGDQPLNCRKKKNRELCRAIAEQRAEEEAQRAAEEALANANWRVYNRTGLELELRDCDGTSFRVGRNEVQPIPEGSVKCGLTGYVVLPDLDRPGMVHKVLAEYSIAPRGDGWVFEAPQGGL